MKKCIHILLLCSIQALFIQGEDMTIKHVVIPAAGLGTRFLPWTKELPKELLPIVNKPALEYVVQESIDSGITNFVMIINEHKDTIRRYFSIDKSLNKRLAAHGKLEWISDINHLCSITHMDYVNQTKQLGLGDAILQAKGHITNDYFGVILPDDIIASEVPALKQLIEIAQKYNASVIAVQEVPQEKVSSYGVIAFDQQLEDRVFNITKLVEKPSAQEAPSNLAVVGRYVLSRNIFQSLETIAPGAGGEYQLTDALEDMLQKDERILAVKINGIRFDTGNPQGWLKAVNYYAQQ